MGNGLRKAIVEERWDKVRSLLDDVQVQSRVRHKIYTAPSHISGGGGGAQAQERVNALHLVLRQHAPADIVQKIIEIDGRSPCHYAQPSGELPLHCAVRYKGCGNRRKIIHLLIDAYPEAIHKASVDGNLPIHIACSKLRPVRVLRLLMDDNTNDSSSSGGRDDEEDKRNSSSSSEQQQEEEGLRGVLDSNGDSPWDIIKKNSRFWHVFYRKRARKLLKIKPQTTTTTTTTTTGEETNNQNEQENIVDTNNNNNKDETFMNAVTADVEVFDGDTFHPAQETYEEDIIKDDSVHHHEATTEGENKDQNHHNDPGLCVLCWDGVADHALIPCGHICLCARCCKENLPTLPPKCPVCNRAFERFMRVYNAGVISKS